MTSAFRLRTLQLAPLAAVLLLALGMGVMRSRSASASSDVINVDTLPYKVIIPMVGSPEVPPVPHTLPAPGIIQTIYLGTAGITMNPEVEQRSSYWSRGREYLQDPSAPARVAWYSGLARIGYPGQNTMLAAHINYVDYGNGPFAYLSSALVGDALYVTLQSGTVYTYTVRSVDVLSLDTMDMNLITHPALDHHTERVTLMSCGGTFVPNPSGYGGHYNSRVVLVAERYID